MKVDISISGRSDSETLEPGYDVWRPTLGATTDTFEKDGVKFTFSVPEGAEYNCRSGWSKSYIQNAEYKAQNGRLTFDGLSLDPSTECGEIILTIEGLPKGTHTLQTYHNRWENPDNFNGWPISVKVNGTQAHSRVETTFKQSVAANACLLTMTLNVANDGDKMTVSFYTLESDTPADMSKGKNNKAPVINGFELNTASIASQAKEPNPASDDIHVDADNGTYQLSWTAASASVVKHRLFIGTDEQTVEAMTVPVVELTEPTYTVTDLYSLNTYYWRVDEVDGNGNVTKGNVWNFRPRQLAFPGAEGYGRYATGGRGGIVYHVTNLGNEMSPGSFIYGLKGLTGPRTIVFDVSGIITMSESPLDGIASVFTNPFLTIAAQTAPGKGICLRYCNIGVGEESIVRHLRAKRGYGATGNAMGANSNQIILDHVTAAWGTDETFSSRGAKNITFQYSMIAEALGIADHKNYESGKNHGFAATIGGDVGTFSHNLLVNCNGRNWSMGGGLDGAGYYAGRLDIFNNVCYNWCGRTTDGGAHEVNFVGNYYKEGPAVSNHCLFTLQLEGTGKGTQSAYLYNNIRDNKNGTIDIDKSDMKSVQIASSQTVDWTYWGTEPYFPSYATIDDAKLAYKKVLSDVGATMPCRDEQHVRVVGETLNRSYTYVGSRSGIKGEIDHEDDCGGFEVYPEETRAADFDTDQDGMPDWWEKITGSNPAVADNNADPNKDGWTLLEDYLDFMAHPYLIVSPDGEATFDASPEFRGFTNSPVFSITTDGTGFSATVSGSVITVKAGNGAAVGKVMMKVTDADGSSFEKPLGVAVTGSSSAINTPAADNYTVAKREFFTLDGKPATTFKPFETYLIRETDTTGKVHTMKAIRNAQ